MAKKQSYDNESITMLKGPDKVRKRPGVIFGSDGPDGCAHSIFEVISNSIDEARAGYGSKIIVTHDLSLLEQVDQIVVLENGVLKGCGTYQDLQENCETFRELLMAGCEKKEAAQ